MNWIVNYVIEITIERDHINCSCVLMVRINLGQLSMSRDMGTGFASISMRERTRKCRSGVVGWENARVISALLASKELFV